MYSACQSPDCRCAGWKLPNEQKNSRDAALNYSPHSKDLCNNENCKHTFSKDLKQ